MNGLVPGWEHPDDRDDEADCGCSTMSMVFRSYGDMNSRGKPDFGFAKSCWTRGSIWEGVRNKV